MSDLEEGEITDSDKDECPRKVDESKAAFSAAKTNQSTAVSYRSTKPQQDDSEESDGSSYSDEDTPLWRCKKAKYLSSNRNEEQSMVTELPQEIKSPARKNERRANPIWNSENAKRKINNVWGSVLTEQTLTQDLKDVGVKTTSCDNSRSVEKYDFTLKYDDTRPDLADEVCETESHDPFNKVVELPEADSTGNRKRKRTHKERRPVKDRINVSDKREFKEPLPDLEAEKVVKMIARKLNEPKVYLIERIYRIIGKEKTLDLFYKTQDIEEAGGLLIQNKTRRRSPGGVYIHLLKSDNSISKENIQEIFAKEEEAFIHNLEEIKRQRREQNQKRKERRKLRRLLPQSKLMEKSRFQKSSENMAESEKREEAAMESPESNRSGSESESALYSEPETGQLGLSHADDKDVVEIDIGVDEMID
ncbi:phosphorylated adapter RNA export protein-like [Crassostrea virginica]|uniref:Phosphorylated adapter RNA export protein n=1 Tax=Crassostrea virginica TaxID=6565 RepID=A0A8B8E3N9_CRAVI|nr:phosphorylated adapter RNA export protein-like [Crassostrea virginica]